MRTGNYCITPRFPQGREYLQKSASPGDEHAEHDGYDGHNGHGDDGDRGGHDGCNGHSGHLSKNLC